MRRCENDYRVVVNGSTFQSFLQNVRTDSRGHCNTLFNGTYVCFVQSEQATSSHIEREKERGEGGVQHLGTSLGEGYIWAKWRTNNVNRKRGKIAVALSQMYYHIHDTHTHTSSGVLAIFCQMMASTKCLRVLSRGDKLKEPFKLHQPSCGSSMFEIHRTTGTEIEPTMYLTHVLHPSTSAQEMHRFSSHLQYLKIRLNRNVG